MTQSSLTPQAPLDLGRLEAEAKIGATKYVANLLQRPDQLERVDQYRRRVARKKKVFLGQIEGHSCSMASRGCGGTGPILVGLYQQRRCTSGHIRFVFASSDALTFGTLEGTCSDLKQKYMYPLRHNGDLRAVLEKKKLVSTIESFLSDIKWAMLSCHGNNSSDNNSSGYHGNNSSGNNSSGDHGNNSSDDHGNNSSGDHGNNSSWRDSRTSDEAGWHDPLGVTMVHNTRNRGNRTPGGSGQQEMEIDTGGSHYTKDDLGVSDLGDHVNNSCGDLDNSGDHVNNSSGNLDNSGDHGNNSRGNNSSGYLDYCGDHGNNGCGDLDNIGDHVNNSSGDLDNIGDHGNNSCGDLDNIGDHVNNSSGDLDNISDHVNNSSGDLDNIGDHVNNSSVYLDNIGDHVNNSSGDLDNIGDHGNNSCGDLDNIGDHVNNSSGDLDNISDHVNNSSGDLDNSGDHVNNSSGDLDNISDITLEPCSDIDDSPQVTIYIVPVDDDMPNETVCDSNSDIVECVEYPSLTIKRKDVEHVEGTGDPATNLRHEDSDEADLDLSDESDSIDEEDIIRDIKRPGLFIRKVLKSETTKHGRRKKDTRVYNSFHYCSFCEKLVSNFSQHIQRKHKEQETVKSIFEEGNESERKNNISLLSSEMGNTNNLKNLKRGKGEIILNRRPNKVFCVDCYGPCSKCFSWISKKMLHRHQSSCVVRGRRISTSALVTQSDLICGRLDTEASSGLTNEVFPYMLNDTIGKIARTDKLIISLGNMWLEKNVGNKLKRGKYTSQIMRLVARLLCNLREINKDEETMSNFLKPCYFNDIAKATLMTAGASNDDKEDLAKPSNAIKLGHDVKRLINIKIGLAILTKDPNSKAEGMDLLQTMQIFWATRITKLARVILQDRQYNKRPDLPDASDIEKLNRYLTLEMGMIDLQRIDIDNYKQVAKLVCAKLVMYNRRRTGEIEAIRIKDYEARVSGGEDSLVVGELTTFEKKLLETQDVMTVRGKTGKGVPIIIPENAKVPLQFLASSSVRRNVGINMESPYLMATEGNMKDVVRVYDMLAKCCEEADLQYPARITSTNLRKYMATITQVLDLTSHQMEWVVKHMGHTLDVHKIYYRSTSDVIERTQIAKILLLQDSGRLHEFMNKSLDEIQLTDLVDSEEVPGEVVDSEEVPGELDELMNQSETMTIGEEVADDLDEAVADGSSDQTICPKKRNSSRKRCPNTKQKWTEQEEEEIKTLFKTFLDTKVRPLPKHCLKAIKISKRKGGVIWQRKKDVLKKKIFRMVDSLKK